MLEGKMTRLLDALLSKTRSKTINWQETPAQNKYLATVGKGSVTIQMVSYASALPDYVLAILDEYGQEIESDTKSSPSRGPVRRG